MFNNKGSIIVLVIIFSLITCSVLTIPSKTEPRYSTSVSNKLTSTTEKLTKNTNNFQDSPINITNDNDLATIATSGIGSSSDPYIINNLIINNCKGNETGINVENTNEYFTLTNITITGCKTGFLFSNVTFGSIVDSYVTNFTYIGIQLKNSSENTLLGNSVSNIMNQFQFATGLLLSNFSNNNYVANNTVNRIPFGFAIIHSNYNYLINNRDIQADSLGFVIEDYSSFNVLKNNNANNYYTEGFEIRNYCNNNILTNNIATNGFIGFSIALYSNNTVLKNNIGFDNLNDYILWPVCFNTTLINNNFLFQSNNGKNILGSSYSLSLFGFTTMFAIIILCGVISLIGYSYYNSQQKNSSKENTFDHQPLINKSMAMLNLITGLIDLILVSFVLLPSTTYLTINLNSLNGATYSLLNTGILQVAPISGILLLGGEIATGFSVLIFLFGKSYYKLKIAVYFSFTGFITQIFGFILSFLVYFKFYNTLNNLTNLARVTSIYSYSILPSVGIVLCFLGIFFGFETFYFQRLKLKEIKKKSTKPEAS